MLVKTTSNRHFMITMFDCKVITMEMKSFGQEAI